MSDDYEPEIYGIPMIPFCGIVGCVFLLLVVAVQGGIQLPDTGGSQPHDSDSIQGGDGVRYQYSANCQIVYCDGIGIAASQPHYPAVIFVPIGQSAEDTQKSLKKTQDMFFAGSLPV